MKILFSLLIFTCLQCAEHRKLLLNKTEKSFEIDYNNDRFLLDGEPFRYISGSIHYFRIHPDLWEDRLKRVRAIGLNAIQFYIPWNYHENEEGSFRMDHGRDFIKFMKIAEKLGLYSLVRVGPYICSEWENGGLPWWLLRRSNIVQRTSDVKFTSAVQRWFDFLLPTLRPHIRHNGGPILMIQIENEYGSYYACDNNYTEWLRDISMKHLGEKAVLYTTDGGSEYYLRCGPIKNVFPTVDFGPLTNEEIDKSFAAQRNHLPNGRGPIVNSEFYPGWLVLWGQKTQDLPSTQLMMNSTRHMYSLNASFNYLMIHGGTNFGFWNGAEPNGPVVTSYDFSAPITEAGDITPQYLEIRNFIKSIPYWPNPPQDVPLDNRKIAYGDIRMVHIGALRHLHNNNCVTSKSPLSFEEMDHPYGFMLYTATINKCGHVLRIPDVKDFAYVYLEEKYVGSLIHLLNETELALEHCEVGDKLHILVENQGRQTYETINDYKGILSNVLLDGAPIQSWETCTVSLGRQFDELVYERRRKQKNNPNTKFLHGVFMGTFHAHTNADTFFDFSNWGKGVLIVNGHILGRYWSIGPQMSLYVPAPFLREGANRIIIVELEHDHFGCTDSCILPSVDKPIWKWEKNEEKQRNRHFPKHRKVYLDS